LIKPPKPSQNHPNPPKQKKLKTTTKPLKTIKQNHRNHPETLQNHGENHQNHLETFKTIVEKMVIFIRGFPVSTTHIQEGIDKADFKIEKLLNANERIKVLCGVVG
jgi:superoxide dismutase